MKEVEVVNNETAEVVDFNEILTKDELIARYEQLQKELEEIGRELDEYPEDKVSFWDKHPKLKKAGKIAGIGALLLGGGFIAGKLSGNKKDLLELPGEVEDEESSNEDLEIIEDF